MRKAALSTYVSLVDEAAELSFNALQEFFSDELSRAATQPFFTAVRHILTEPY
jgi:hypothetical protein